MSPIHYLARIPKEDPRVESAMEAVNSKTSIRGLLYEDTIRRLRCVEQRVEPLKIALGDLRSLIFFGKGAR
jgi:hypothetical protein